MAKCTHPIKERQWIDGKLICNLCQTVLRQNNPEPAATEDLFSGEPPAPKPCDQEDVCINTGETCTDDKRIENCSACFEAAAPPGNETPFDELPGGTEVDPASIPPAPETVSASEEGLTVGNKSQAFKAPVNVQVTPIQLGEYSLEQATLYRELKETEQAKKDTAKAYADRITRIEVRLDELSKIVTEGVIEVPIDCQWEFHYEMGVKRLVRLDTHEVVDEKTLTTEEYQMDIGFQEQESVAAVEECFKTEEAGSSAVPPEEIIKEAFRASESAVIGLLPGQCPECLFKNGNHSPTCSQKPEETYSLCQCGVCGAEAACIPFDKCKECGEGLMEPADVGEYPSNEESHDEEPT